MTEALASDTAQTTDRLPGKRLAVAGAIVALLVVLASAVSVQAGSAMVITRFGKPVRVHTEPGLYWRWPAPIEQAAAVDLRLRTTSSGRYNVQVGDGSILEIEAFATWTIPADETAITTFMRAVGNDPRQAASKLRTVMGSAMQVASGRFTVPDFLNVDAEKVRIEAFESVVREQVEQAMRTAYGVSVGTIGVERLAVPATLVDTTITAMIKDREVLAEKRRGAGLQKAAAVLAEAEATAREHRAQATAESAQLIADAEKEAAALYRRAYERDPELYAFLRSLDSLRATLSKQTTLILRTDAAPLRLLVDGPQTTVLGPDAISLRRAEDAPDPQVAAP